MTPQRRAPGRYLDTLAYRCSPDLVGDDTVYLRHLSPETRSLWENFERACKDRYGNESAQAPYSIATTVLSVLTGGYVHFEPRGPQPFLASREPIDDKLLCRVFTLTYGLAHGVAIHEIDLRRPPEVAQSIADTPQEKAYLAQHIQPQKGVQPVAPNWVYRTITWGLAQKLAGPWAIRDGLSVTLRPDVTGGLVTLDDPWESDQGGRYALSRTALSLETVPNIANPVLMVTSRVTRISDSLIFSRTVLAVQSGENRPILEVGLHGGGGARTISRYALEALGRLDMDYSILQAIATRSQAEQRMRAEAIAAAGPDDKARLTFSRERPGQIWPVLAKNRQFPIGVGTGMHHLRVLNKHIVDQLGDLAQPIVARATTLTLPHRPSDAEKVSKAELDRRKAAREAGADVRLRGKGTAFPDPASIAAAVKAAGFTKLRLVGLWYRDETRLRMIATLANTYGLATEGLDPLDGQEIDLYGGTVTAVFHFMGDFLAHGSPHGRTKALMPAEAALDSSGGALVGTWCETHVPTTEDAPGLKAAELEELDAKPQTKMILAGRDIASQYLLGKNAQGIIAPKASDFPSEMALLDLYRSLGIIDDRIANALRPEARHAAYGADRIAHVGFHIRQQNNRKREKGAPKAVVTATALVPPAVAGDVWQLRGWSSTAARWQPYRCAQNEFHATNYPSEAGGKKSHRQRWDDIGAIIERALEDLVEELDGRPYVVTVDEDSARRIWDGLQNSKQGLHPDNRKSKYWLPGCTLPADERPDAVIRINIADDRVPAPIGYTHVLSSREEEKEGETTKALYEIETDFSTPVWLLCNVPRNYDGGNSGRLGAKYTRWDAKHSVNSENREERRKSEIPEPWYSMTATEVFPIALNDRVSVEALAFATAQLCHQTLFWSDRARYPVALHAAIQMDKDHPSTVVMRRPLTRKLISTPRDELACIQVVSTPERPETHDDRSPESG